MRIDLKQDVVSLTDFARNTKQHAKELALGGRARILTQNGKGDRGTPAKTVVSEIRERARKRQSKQ